MKSVVCFGDCLKFPKCNIFCVHWLPGFQTPTLTVANKPHIYYLKQIIRQWIVWSALMTASCLLSVLALLWLEDKMLTQSAFRISVLPSPINNLADQRFTPALKLT